MAVSIWMNGFAACCGSFSQPQVDFKSKARSMAAGSQALSKKPQAPPAGDLVFNEAFEAARTGYSDVAWESLTPRERTEAIYREMRRLDQGKTNSPRGANGTGGRRFKLVQQNPDQTGR